METQAVRRQNRLRQEMQMRTMVQKQTLQILQGWQIQNLHPCHLLPPNTSDISIESRALSSFFTCSFVSRISAAPAFSSILCGFRVPCIGTM